MHSPFADPFNFPANVHIMVIIAGNPKGLISCHHEKLLLIDAECPEHTVAFTGVRCSFSQSLATVYWFLTWMFWNVGIRYCKRTLWSTFSSCNFFIFHINIITIFCLLNHPFLSLSPSLFFDSYLTFWIRFQKQFLNHCVKFQICSEHRFHWPQCQHPIQRSNQKIVQTDFGSKHRPRCKTIELQPKNFLRKGFFKDYSIFKWQFMIILTHIDIFFLADWKQ